MFLRGHGALTVRPPSSVCVRIRLRPRPFWRKPRYVGMSMRHEWDSRWGHINPHEMVGTVSGEARRGGKPSRAQVPLPAQKMAAFGLS